MEQELRQLGKLSEQYETRYPGPKGAGVVSLGTGDAGGVSYGSYQIASKTGTAATFVQWIRVGYPEFYTRLHPYVPGSLSFGNSWRQLAKETPERFFEAQHLFIAETHYLPARRGVEKELKFSLKGRSLVLKDALWSCAVQHGPRAAYSRIWRAALLLLPSDRRDDASVLQAVYAERGRKDGNGKLVHFSRCSVSVQCGVAERFRRELAQALEWLK